MDKYAWLKDKSNPKVIEHLTKENEQVEKLMGHTKDLQKQLYDEILGRIKETDLQVPYKKGPYFYYIRVEKGKNYPICCRKKDTEGAEEETLLDINKLAEGKDFLDLGDILASPDHNLLAYVVDYNGAEYYDLYIKDLRTGEFLPDKIEKIAESFTWAEDSRTLFYMTMDETQRPDKVHRYVLGQKEDAALVYHDPDPAFYVGLQKSRDNQVIFLISKSKLTSEISFLDANEPNRPCRLIEPRKQGIDYAAYHRHGNLYIATNEEATNFKVMVTSAANPGKAHWKEFLPHDPERRILDLEMFENHMALFERYKGLCNFRIVRFPGKETHDIAFPEAAFTANTENNKEFKTNRMRLSYESPITPPTTYDYDLDTRTLKLLKRKEVPGGYDPNRYEVEHLFAKADDGEEVPITLLRQKEFKKDGATPLFLSGYGAYEATYDPHFLSPVFSLVDRGFCSAIAHVRGGGEKGRLWYENGKLLKKKNTFTDFIACAEHLIRDGYTSAGRIVINGGSAGGLLMGAVTNMRPDLWGAVLGKVPFVDVVNTMLDDKLPLTVTEYEEWGNPNEKEYLEYMKSYSPYDNIERKDYPTILATAGLNDPRVGYWEPAKWIAKLREYKTDDNWALLKTELGTGHGGPSGRYKRIEEQAFYYAFILDRLGVTR